MSALTALLALAAAGAALAATIRDRDDAAPGAVDLSAVRAAHNRVTDELVYLIDLHDPLDPRVLLSDDGPPGSVCVNVWTRRRPGEGAPDYDVCAGPDRAGRLHASVARHGASGGVRRVGAADVEQTGERRLELRIDPDDIRRPRSYRWTVESVTFGAGCPAATGCEDYVPDRPRTARTTLGKPRSR